MFKSGIDPDRIFLAGFMGAGKSTVGVVLAQKLNWSFQDTDTVIEQKVGTSIQDLIKASGEVAFRQMETEVLKVISLKNNHVTALGGGSFLSLENQSLLNSKGTVIYLKTSQPILIERLSKDLGGSGRRPLIRDAAGKLSISLIEDLISRRAPLYEMASYSILTDGKSQQQVAEEIVQMIPRLRA